jgi:broad specificity phosphatase PhoE
MSLSDLILIRHGQSLANINCSTDPDCELTPLGHQQARDLAQRLKGLPLDGFVGLVSPYRRALQTAEHITDAIGLRFEIDEAVREFGTTCTINGSRYSAESPGEFVERMKKFLGGATGRLLVVSHGSPIAYLAQLANGFDMTVRGPIHQGIGNAQFRWISDPVPFAAGFEPAGFNCFETSGPAGASER